MAAYGSEFHNDVVQIKHDGLNIFGSGRLIGPNLVLTARHVVRGKDFVSGWKCRRVGDKPPDYPTATWTWIDAAVVYVSDGHDLALLRVSESASLSPLYRTRIATVKTNSERPVEAAGFPEGAEDEGRSPTLDPPRCVERRKKK